MAILFFMVLCITLFGPAFVKIPVMGIELIYICILAMLLYYVYEAVIKRRLKIQGYEGLLFAFIVYGVIRAGCSMLGVTDFLVSDKLLIDTRFLPRQAFYLALMPVAFLTLDSPEKHVIYDFVKKHHSYLSWGVVLVNVIWDKGMSLWIPELFVLCFLTLLNDKKTPSDWLMAVLIVFCPVLAGGEMTNLLIRIVFLTFFIFGKKSKFALWGMAAGIWLCIGLCFILPLMLPELESMLDANSLWRACYWADELNMVAKSSFLGVGFGTSYASADFLNPFTYQPWGDGDPFVATAQYTIYDKVFVTGPHNSFVSVAFRLGIIGIVLFVLYLIALQIKQLKSIQSISVGSLYLSCSSLIIIALNVGLENPGYLLMFLFAVYCSSYELAQCQCNLNC